MEQEAHYSLKAGTAGGVIFTFIMNIHLDDIAKTILMAGIGATVSFAVSLLLRNLVKWFKNRPARRI